MTRPVGAGNGEDAAQDEERADQGVEQVLGDRLGDRGRLEQGRTRQRSGGDQHQARGQRPADSRLAPEGHDAAGRRREWCPCWCCTWTRASPMPDGEPREVRRQPEAGGARDVVVDPGGERVPGDAAWPPSPRGRSATLRPRSRRPTTAPSGPAAPGRSTPPRRGSTCGSGRRGATCRRRSRGASSDESQSTAPAPSLPATKSRATTTATTYTGRIRSSALLVVGAQARARGRPRACRAR